MNKITNIYLSYWFNELDYNPSSKVNELEDEIKSIIDTPLMYMKEENNRNISVPRIEGMSGDKKYFFTMSLINSFLSINLNEEIDIDEAILLINSNIQLFYDILRRVYNVHIVYTSIKLDIVNDEKNMKEELIRILNLKPDNYEDLSFKRGLIKDDYYINYSLSYSKEYNFNVKSDKEVIEQDLFDRSMITSLSKANLNKEYLLTIVEINDRYAYNLDSLHETKKDDIRGMIIELKDILENEKYLEI